MNIHLIYALASLAYSNARSGKPASTKAGVMVTQPGDGTLSTIREMAGAMKMEVQVIRMAQLIDRGEDVRTVRRHVEDALAEGKPTIFVLADAEGSDGEMLMRVTRVIDVANTSTQVVIMAIGQGVSADVLAMDVAGGMTTSRDFILGSSQFEDSMKVVLERA